MATCNLNTILTDAAANGSLNLDDRGTLLAIAGALSDQLGGVSAQTAVTNGEAFLKLDDRTLNMVLAAALCPP